MALFAWLDTSRSNEFAAEIVAEFCRNYPVDGTFKTDKEREKRLVHSIEVMGNRALKFHQDDPLGWYRKSRFLNTIKSSLAKAGYSGELIKRVVYAIVLKTARITLPGARSR